MFSLFDLKLLGNSLSFRSLSPASRLMRDPLRFYMLKFFRLCLFDKI